MTWTPGRVVGLMLIAASLVLFVWDVLAPNAGTAAFDASRDSMSHTWSVIYDEQHAHLVEIESAAEVLAFAGALLVWAPRPLRRSMKAAAAAPRVDL